MPMVYTLPTIVPNMKDREMSRTDLLFSSSLKYSREECIRSGICKSWWKMKWYDTYLDNTEM